MIHEDPIYDIRVAVAGTLRELYVAGDHKRITDAVVDALPDFFRQTFRPVNAEDLVDSLTNMIDEGIRKSKYSTYEEWREAVSDVVN